MKKYILLDWDGNLLQTLDVWLEACRVPLVNRNIHLTDKEIASGFGGIQHLKNKWTQWGVTDFDVAIDEMDAYARNNLPKAELYPHALLVVEELHKRGKKLALITSSFRHLVEGALLKHNLTDMFDVVITGTDVSHHKPHPEPLDTAIKKLNATKQETIMIGDMDSDIEAAANAGVDSILFYPKEHEIFYDVEQLTSSNPTHIVKDFREILTIV